MPSVAPRQSSGARHCQSHQMLWAVRHEKLSDRGSKCRSDTRHFEQKAPYSQPFERRQTKLRVVPYELARNRVRGIPSHPQAPLVIPLEVLCTAEASGTKGIVTHTTVLCRSIQVCSTSSIGLLHQCSEKISISE